MTLREYLKRKGLLARVKARLRRPPVPKHPMNLELEYARILVDYVDEMRKRTKPLIESMVQRLDASEPDEFSHNLTLRLHSFINPEAMSQHIGAKVDRWNKQQWGAYSKKTLGIDVFHESPNAVKRLERFRKENAKLISSIPRRLHSEVSTMVSDAFRTGTRAGSLAVDIERRFAVSESRARLIARDQIGKLNGDLTRVRQVDLGIDHYIWRTLRDERVRGRPGGWYSEADPDHWAMDGRKCKWSDSSVVFVDGEWVDRDEVSGPYAHPGEDIQCRCIAEPVLEDILGEDISDLFDSAPM